MEVYTQLPKEETITTMEEAVAAMSASSAAVPATVPIPGLPTTTKNTARAAEPVPIAVEQATCWPGLAKVAMAPAPIATGVSMPIMEMAFAENAMAPAGATIATGLVTDNFSGLFYVKDILHTKRKRPR